MKTKAPRPPHCDILTHFYSHQWERNLCQPLLALILEIEKNLFSKEECKLKEEFFLRIEAIIAKEQP